MVEARERIRRAMLALDRPVCLHCLVRKTGTSVTEVEAALQDIGQVLELGRHTAQSCHSCEKDVLVYWLQPPVV